MSTTVSWSISKHHKKQDGTYNAKIRIIHNRTISYMSTGVYTNLVRFKKGASYGIVTDSDIEDNLNDKVKQIRKIINDNLIVVENLETAKDVICFIHKVIKRNGTDIDFIRFAKTKIEKISNNGTKSVFVTSLNVLQHYMHYIKEDKLYVSKITSKFLRNYESWLRSYRNVIIKNKSKTLPPLTDTGVRLYMSSFRKLFNDMQNMYNDYETNDIIIKHNPWKAYKIPDPSIPPKKSLQKETLLAIYNYNIAGRTKRDILARDIFILSFVFAGMNIVDMFYCDKISNNRIEYNRQKTKNRKKDKAFISLPIIDEVEALMEKYKDKTGKRVFNFYQSYKNHILFYQSVRRGLKILCKNIGIQYIQFYSARHSFATIARFGCGYSLDDISFCLTHSSGHNITDTYISPDYTIIDKVIRDVVDFVLKGNEK